METLTTPPPVEVDAYGLLAERPAADSVPVGSTFFASDFGAVFVSNGTAAGGSEANGWSQVSARKELGYAQITANFPTTSTVGVDVPGLAITVLVGSRPIALDFGGYLLTPATAARFAIARIFEGATQLGETAMSTPAAAAIQAYMMCRARVAPSPGLHTYKMQLLTGGGAGTSQILATAVVPAFLQAQEL